MKKRPVDRLQEQLIDACIYGDHKKVKLALAAGADPNIPAPNRTAFHVAAKNAHVAIAKALFALGTDIDSPDHHGSSPLAELVGDHSSDLDFVAWLLDQGAKIDAENHDGWTPLMFASKWDKRWNPLVRLLVARGADVNHRSRDGWTPLLLAINANYRLGDGPVSVLLDSPRIDPNLAGVFGWTPLCFWAARPSCDAILHALLASGADVNLAMRVGGAKHRCFTLEAKARQRESKTAAAYDGFTPLMWAAQKNRLAAARRLCAAGADVHARTPSGVTAQTLAKAGMKRFLDERLGDATTKSPRTR